VPAVPVKITTSSSVAPAETDIDTFFLVAVISPFSFCVIEAINVDEFPDAVGSVFASYLVL
jgi:hypothetical protein